MSKTRKVVTVEVIATFEGDYYDAGECPRVLEYWIDGGFEDRDNLRGWKVKHVSTVETPLDDAEDEAA
jgi:hypothetical protein